MNRLLITITDFSPNARLNAFDFESVLGPDYDPLNTYLVKPGMLEIRVYDEEDKDVTKLLKKVLYKNGSYALIGYDVKVAAVHKEDVSRLEKTMKNTPVGPSIVEQTVIIT